MLLLSKEDMKEVFTMRDAVEAVKESFRLFSAGKGEAPGHANIHAPEHGGLSLIHICRSKKLHEICKNKV